MSRPPRYPLSALAIVRAMTRIPYVRREELGPEGQRLWDGIVSSAGEHVVTAGDGLAGPFNAFVTAPGAGRRADVGRIVTRPADWAAVIPPNS
jgi:hypothetical protein